ncbi:MAG: cell division protein SepF [Armatimonadetes bacterium]|nr:cell division protein SepF [Armatimonadota bacterium]
MSVLQQALDYLGWRNDELDGEQVEPDEYDDLGGLDERTPSLDNGVTPLRHERAEFAGVSIVRADPKNMDQATTVADEIKRRRPVLLNLQGAAEPEAKRVRDFLAGVTYGLNGYMRRIADWVFICAPFDMPVEKLMLDGPRSSEARYEHADRRPIQEL